MKDFRLLLAIKSCIFTVSLHLLLRKRREARTSLVEYFALHVVTGKGESTTCVKSRNWHQESVGFWKKSGNDQ